MKQIDPKIFLLIAIPVVIFVFFGIDPLISSASKKAPKPARPHALIEQLNRDDIISWQQAAELKRINFKNEWIKANTIDECGLLINERVLCVFEIRSEEVLTLPLPDKTCTIVDGAGVNVLRRIQFDDDDRKWSPWETANNRHPVKAFWHKKTKISYKLSTPNDDPVDVYVVRFPFDLAGSHCGARLFLAVRTVLASGVKAEYK